MGAMQRVIIVGFIDCWTSVSGKTALVRIVKDINRASAEESFLLFVWWKQQYPSVINWCILFNHNPNGPEDTDDIMNTNEMLCFAYAENLISVWRPFYGYNTTNINLGNSQKPLNVIYISSCGGGTGSGGVWSGINFDINTVAISGTNGKTTITYLISNMLQSYVSHLKMNLLNTDCIPMLPIKILDDEILESFGLHDCGFCDTYKIGQFGIIRSHGAWFSSVCQKARSNTRVSIKESPRLWTVGQEKYCSQQKTDFRLSTKGRMDMIAFHKREETMFRVIKSIENHKNDLSTLRNSYMHHSSERYRQKSGSMRDRNHTEVRHGRNPCNCTRPAHQPQRLRSLRKVSIEAPSSQLTHANLSMRLPFTAFDSGQCRGKTGTAQKVGKQVCTKDKDILLQSVLLGNSCYVPIETPQEPFCDMQFLL